MRDGGVDVVARHRDDALLKTVGIVDSDQCAVVVDADEKVAAERVGKRDDFLFYVVGPFAFELCRDRFMRGKKKHVVLLVVNIFRVLPSCW